MTAYPLQRIEPVALSTVDSWTLLDPSDPTTGTVLQPVTTPPRPNVLTLDQYRIQLHRCILRMIVNWVSPERYGFEVRSSKFDASQGYPFVQLTAHNSRWRALAELQHDPLTDTVGCLAIKLYSSQGHYSTVSPNNIVQGWADPTEVASTMLWAFQHVKVPWPA